MSPPLLHRRSQQFRTLIDQRLFDVELTELYVNLRRNVGSMIEQRTNHFSGAAIGAQPTAD